MQFYPVDEIASPRIAAAGRECEGCSERASDVGPLMPYRVTFRSGRGATVEYCESCAAAAKLSVEHPGLSYGASALPTEIVAVRRLVNAGALSERDRTDWFAVAGEICRPRPSRDETADLLGDYYGDVDYPARDEDAS